MFSNNIIFDIAGVFLIALIAIGFIFSRLYRRSSKQVSFVRTGLGGQKVIVNGGAVVLPVVHETIPVNMNTLRLEVKRANDQALITRDRMRVDVQAEFYVRVKPTAEAISHAAQTLGTKTMKPEMLAELVEGKFVDALRSVAAEMTMIELQEQRVDFVQKVQQVVSEDLLKNGLELETVSLTGLDQTGKEFFNPDNAFDAEGLTHLTEEIQLRRKRRNQIEQDTEVEVRKKNLEAKRLKLELNRDEEYAQLQQEQEIAIRAAAQKAEIARQEAVQQRESEQAKIKAQQQIDEATIVSERAVEEAQIEKQKLLTERNIQKSRAIDQAEIEKQKAIKLSDQDRAIAIAIAEKSKEQSVTEAAASITKAEAIKEEEKITTAQEWEIAEREKQIDLINAAKQAERLAINVTVAAQGEKQAAEDKAQSVRILAEAEAEKQRLSAKGQADAELLAADAAAKRYQVDAEGKQAIHEADNRLSEQQIAMQIKLATVHELPSIIRESVKPMEQIEGIKIIQMNGLPGVPGTDNGNLVSADRSPKNLAEQVVDSALQYRVQAPLLDTLLKEVGFSGQDINDLAKNLQVEETNPSLLETKEGTNVHSKKTNTVDTEINSQG
ncbi:MAG: flotillin domain-containing protein [Methylococcaceae bacterium]